jgi:HK97 family phage major capsid protein
MNRYRFLLNRQAALKKEGSDLAALETSWTDEQRKRAGEIAAELAQVETDLAIVKQLHDAERVAPAAGATGVTVHDNRADDPTRGFRGLGDFARSVRNAFRQNGSVDERLAVSQMLAAPSGEMSTTGSVGEGYDIPPQYRQEIFELMLAGPSLLSLVNPEPTDANQVRLIADENTPWGAAGVQAYWRAEGAQLTASKLATKGRSVDLHELAAYVLATEELLEDAPRLGSRISKSAAEALAFKASQAIFDGNGVGQPLGFAAANNAALVSVAKESGQAADTIVAANVAKMYARALNPGKGIWLVNADTLPQFLTMTLANQPIWTPPSSGFTGAPGGFLFGRPIVPTEHNATLGDKGDIVFFDPSGYFAAIKNGGLKFASSIHLFFDYNTQAFRWTMRFGGQPYLSAAVSPNKGNATKSHFVTLDARA